LSHPRHCHAPSLIVCHGCRTIDSEIRRRDEIIDIQKQDITSLRALQQQQNETIDLLQHEQKRLLSRLRIHQATTDQHVRDKDELTNELHAVRQRNDVMEQAAVGEFRRNRRQIEERLNVLQDECAQLAGMLANKQGVPAAAVQPSTPLSRQSSFSSPSSVRNGGGSGAFAPSTPLSRSTPSPSRRGSHARTSSSFSVNGHGSHMTPSASSSNLSARPSSASRYASPDRPRSLVSIPDGHTHAVAAYDGADSIATDEDWTIPSNIAAVTEDFRFNLAKSGGPGLRSGVVASYMITLNKLWLQRLAERLGSVRRQHAREMRDERRRWAHTIPYEQVIGRATNARLRRIVEQQRQGNARTYVVMHSYDMYMSHHISCACV
jgi:hypothetical protein